MIPFLLYSLAVVSVIMIVTCSAEQARLTTIVMKTWRSSDEDWKTTYTIIVGYGKAIVELILAALLYIVLTRAAVYFLP